MKRQHSSLVVGCSTTTSSRSELATIGSNQAVLLARRTRTIGMCSFDARNRGSTSPPFEEKTSELGGNIDDCLLEIRGPRRPSRGLMGRLGLPVGGRVRKLRAVKINQPPSLGDDERAWKGGRGAARLSFLLAEAARSECAPSMCALKDSLAAPLRAKWGKSDDLRWMRTRKVSWATRLQKKSSAAKPRKYMHFAISRVDTYRQRVVA